MNYIFGIARKIPNPSIYCESSKGPEIWSFGFTEQLNKVLYTNYAMTTNVTRFR